MITYTSIGSIIISTSSPKGVAIALKVSRTIPIANGTYDKHIRSTPTNSTTARSASVSVRFNPFPAETSATVMSEQCILTIHGRRPSKPEKDRDQKKPEKSDPEARQALVAVHGAVDMLILCKSVSAIGRSTEPSNPRTTSCCVSKGMIHSFGTIARDSIGDQEFIVVGRPHN